jgi:hypothetical protein
MSKISTVYDSFLARVVAVLPNHRKLSDPYQFKKNTDSEKRQGFGLKVGPGLNTFAQLSCNMILQRDMSLVISRISQGRETDRDKKAEAEKQLLEDLFLVIQDVESSPTLGSASVIGCDYLDDGGIQFYYTERDDVLYIEANFKLKYVEDFN